ncbi:MAG: type IV pilus modification protein PilV [Candidatus Binatia bacterium]
MRHPSTELRFRIPHSAFRTDRGFTLLEVMVALAVLAVGIVAALDAFGGSLRLTTKASRRTQAAIYAQNVMDRVLAQSILEDGEENGEFPGGFTWRVQVSEVPPDEDESRLQPNRPNQNEFFHLKQVDVGIFWNEGTGEQSFVLHSLRTVTEQSQAQNQ